MVSALNFVNCIRERRLFWVLIGAFFWNTGVFEARAQTLSQLEEAYQSTNNIQEKVKLARSLSQGYFHAEQWSPALEYSQYLDSLATIANQPILQFEGRERVGRIYEKQGQLDLALNAHLSNLNLAEKINKKELLRDVYQSLGNLYFKQEAFAKSKQNYAAALAIAQEEKNAGLSAILLEKMGDLDHLQKDYASADANYKKTRVIYQNEARVKAENKVLEKLSQNSLDAGDLKGALSHNEAIIELNRKIGDGLSLANSLNNLGYVYRELGDEKNALKYMRQARDLNQAFVSKEQDKMLRQRDALFALNLGVTYANTGEFRNARLQFKEAQNIYNLQNDQKGLANSYNYLAASEYKSGRNELALRNLAQAVSLAQEVNAPEVLETAYWLYSEIYQKTGNYRKSQEYYADYQRIKAQIEEQKRAKEQSLLETQLQIEKKEGEIRMLISEKERQALSLKQLALEANQREQELDLKASELASLKKDQELQEAEFRNQQLEKQRVLQLLELNRQKSLAEKQQLLADKRKQEADKSKLVAENEKIAREKEAEARKAAEKQQEIQDLRLKEEESLRKYGIGLIFLMALVVLLIGFGLLQNRRKNKKLALQTEELESFNDRLKANEQVLQKANQKLKSSELRIKEKNEALLTSEEELRQNMEELEANKEEMEAQKEALEDAYQKIEERNNAFMQSVKYAEKIQQANLPHALELKKAFHDHFVIYYPKDVVSGDFYWYSKVGKKHLIACVDCTGHGVPGAFMSLIGSSLLNQIVNEQKITEPGQILANLHVNVVKALKQKETNNIDGMDLSICAIESWDKDEFSLEFSGAKSNVYYHHEGELKTLKGDRKAIGGWGSDTFIEFTTQRIKLRKNDTIYMASDGFEDTPNPKRKKFGTKRIKALLDENHSLKMTEQKAKLVQALKNHQEDTLQRDDVTFLGVQL